MNNKKIPIKETGKTAKIIKMNFHQIDAEHDSFLEDFTPKTGRINSMKRKRP